MINRRKLMIALTAGLATAARVSLAQPTRKVPQVGYVGNASPSLETALVEGFRLGLRERGYVEGKTIEIQYRWANGKINALPALIAELIALKVDVLVTAGTPAALAAKKATATVPIVMAAVGDAVDSGIVPSLARPGGNITGLSTLYTQLEGKRIQILHELVPKLKNVALLTNPANPFTTHMLRSALAATKSRHLTTQVYEVSSVGGFEKVFAAITKSKPDAMAVLYNGRRPKELMLSMNSGRIGNCRVSTMASPRSTTSSLIVITLPLLSDVACERISLRAQTCSYARRCQ